MNLSALSAALERELGFASASVGERQLERAVAQRAAVLGVLPAAYALQAELQPRELVELLGALNIDESWLWRDPAQLEFLRAHLRARDPAMGLRVLCAPCARGEEVWSLAAVLYELGWRAPSCRIIGVELAPPALQLATAAVYPRSAWREAAELPWWLQTTSNGQLKVDSQLRPLVRFECANLLHWQPSHTDQFDLLFSRNFMIYLGFEARSRWLQCLLELAAPGATFWSARSEVLSAMDARFQSIGEGAFECASAALQQAAPVAPPAAATPRPRTVPLRAAPAALPAAPQHASESPIAVSEAPAKHARARLDRALLALQSDDLAQAEGLLREVLYLQRDCEEALLHLAALRIRLGDPVEAQRLRARLSRGVSLPA